MRRAKTLAVALAATALLPAVAMAQQTSPTMNSTQTPPADPAVMPEQKPGHTLSNNYIGASVAARSDEGLETVGQVSELLLNDEQKIVGVVVDVGGFLGIGAKPVGLAWNSLSEEQSETGLLLKTNLTRQDLEDAPEFKTLSDQQVESDQQMMEQQQSAPAQ
jgi:hypothetical protein